ncbi:hypothetical protein HanXRQr2_Chr10g0424081 [Helianthus annuus]|uniref:Uncharacterized protein n=1 Tax=Helianthus annuus TaxID=4232 RepID=A0A9K3HVE6_HELAN|nr:uncharacterized protein LOC110884102 [Helianthus annuus]KAF5785054.1 hypothetical protein HanXRQr2_Chr10g0424081 [Helianthus annuus]
MRNCGLLSLCILKNRDNVGSLKHVVKEKPKMDELEKEISQLVSLHELKLQLKKWAKRMVLDERRRALRLRVESCRLPHMAFLEAEPWQRDVKWPLLRHGFDHQQLLEGPFFGKSDHKCYYGPMAFTCWYDKKESGFRLMGLGSLR